MDLRNKIRVIPDFPKKGILFRDITTLLKDKKAFHEVISKIVGKYKNKKIDIVAGIESRGFILAGAVAYELKAGFVPLRKDGKLPSKKVSTTYKLEYGSAKMEVHEDAFPKNARVLIVDDIIATGGTICAAVDLINALGGKLVGVAVIADLEYLGGSKKLKGCPLEKLMSFKVAPRW